jgi:hypothetical protein
MSLTNTIFLLRATEAMPSDMQQEIDASFKNEVSSS